MNRLQTARARVCQVVKKETGSTLLLRCFFLLQWCRHCRLMTLLAAFMTLHSQEPAKPETKRSDPKIKREQVVTWLRRLPVVSCSLVRVQIPPVNMSVLVLPILSASPLADKPACRGFILISEGSMPCMLSFALPAATPEAVNAQVRPTALAPGECWLRAAR